MTPDELIHIDPKFAAILGPAGSGKTWLIREVLKQHPDFGIITATTGAAARVLGSDIRTLHSTLGIFDGASMATSHHKGDLVDVLKNIRKTYERIVVDECSMLSRQVLEVLIRACDQTGMGLILVGDFAQLPPIEKDYNGKLSNWIFKSPAWERFENNTILLKTQYRFDDADFITAINFLRAGQGEEAIPFLEKAGVTFEPQGSPLNGFQGTCIVATNKRRNYINSDRYDSLDTEEREYKTTRRGPQQLEEWDEIPESVKLKVGARVMILRNLYDEDTEELLQGNGEVGVITKLYEGAVTVLRDSDGKEVDVEMLKAHNGRQHKGHDGEKHFKVIDKKPNSFCEYMPLALSWAMTTHKCQGLTIKTKTKILFEDFFKSPAMVYVACSRVSDPKNLTLVGGDTRVMSPDGPVEVYEVPQLKTLCNTDSNVKKFL